MLDTYTTIYNKLNLRCPAASTLLCRDWVSNAFRQIAERRRWSWKIKYGQFILPALYNTGTVTVTRNSTTVSGVGTTWDYTMVGRQFRVGMSPIYTISQVNSATSLDLDLVWGSTTQSAVGYSIYQAYVTPPDDFHSFLTVWDPNFNWQLWLNVGQEEINVWDAQRSNTGNAYLLSARDYSTTYSGSVGTALQVVGTGPDPVSTSQGNGYTGAVDGVFVVEVTTGGTSTNAIFKWKKDSGSYLTGIVTDTAAQDLQDGVAIYWPSGVTYVAGDTFIIQAKAGLQGGLPRYELWPQQQAAYVYPFLYECRPNDLGDTGATLPRYIRGDVLLEMSLASAARWPGPSNDKPNPYFNSALALQHDKRAEFMIMELERQDDETSEIDARYQALNLPFAPWPFGDSAWLQRHAI